MKEKRKITLMSPNWASNGNKKAPVCVSLPQWSSEPHGNGPSEGMQRINHTAWSFLLSSDWQSPWLKRNRAEDGQLTGFHSKEKDNKLHLFILITFPARMFSAATSTLLRNKAPDESLSLLKCSAQHYMLSLSSSFRTGTKHTQPTFTHLHIQQSRWREKIIPFFFLRHQLKSTEEQWAAILLFSWWIKILFKAFQWYECGGKTSSTGDAAMYQGIYYMKSILQLKSQCWGVLTRILKDWVFK